MSKKKRIELARYVVENCKDCQYREAAKQYLADNPVDDWQELKIDDLPRDFMTGDYEFIHNGPNGWHENEWYKNKLERYLILKGSYQGKEYRYRPRQPEKEEVSHDDIMTKWWEAYGNWYKVVWYSPEEKEPYYLAVGADIGTNKNNLIGYSKTWFTDRASATIPPEAE